MISTATLKILRSKLSHCPNSRPLSMLSRSPYFRPANVLFCCTLPAIAPSTWTHRVVNGLLLYEEMKMDEDCMRQFGAWTPGHQSCDMLHFSSCHKLSRQISRICLTNPKNLKRTKTQSLSYMIYLPHCSRLEGTFEHAMCSVGESGQQKDYTDHFQGHCGDNSYCIALDCPKGTNWP